MGKTQPDKPKEIKVEIMPIQPEETSGGAALMREGAAIVKLENMTQMQMAIQRPRDEAKILRAALMELETYASTAEEAIYSKPVGKDNDTGKMKYAEGLSIRAAESLAQRWTNSAFGAEIISDDGDVVSGAAIFMDYENNTRRCFPFRVSRIYKGKDGSTRRTEEGRFNDIVVKAHISKALREAILRSLPAGLKTEYENKARAIIGQKGASKVGQMIAAFAKLGVSLDMVKRAIGKEVDAANDEDFTKLRGIFNAIREGETTVAEAFPDAAPEQTKQGDDLFKKPANGAMKDAVQNPVAPA